MWPILIGSVMPLSLVHAVHKGVMRVIGVLLCQGALECIPYGYFGVVARPTGSFLLDSPEVDCRAVSVAKATVVCDDLVHYPQSTMLWIKFRGGKNFWALIRPAPLTLILSILELLADLLKSTLDVDAHRLAIIFSLHLEEEVGSDGVSLIIACFACLKEFIIP